MKRSSSPTLQRSAAKLQRPRKTNEQIEHEKVIFLEKIKKEHPSVLKDSVYADDKEFVLEALRITRNGSIVHFASATLQSDKDVVLAAVTCNIGYYSLESLGDGHYLRGDKDVVIAAVSNGSRNRLQFATVALREDKDVVLTAVSSSGYALEYASNALQGDKNVVLVAVANIGGALEHASNALQGDKNVVMVAVSNLGGALEFASAPLREDKEVVMVAVRNDSCALEFASEALRGDREVVMITVRKNGYALRFASEALRGDREVVMTAVGVGRCCCGLGDASETLKSDKSVVLAAVSCDGIALQFASATLQGDKEVVLAAAADDGDALQYADPKLLDCCINGNLAFIPTVIQTSTGFNLQTTSYFPSLKATLSSLLQQLQTSSKEGNLNLKGCAGVLPGAFARQWLDRLWETQWCMKQVCKMGSVTDDVQKHMLEFSWLASDFRSANLLLQYSPILNALLEKEDCGDFNSWWELLEWSAVVPS